MPRTPKAIAAELSELHEKSARLGLPSNFQRALELQREFNASVADLLDAAGIAPPDAAPSSTDPQG